MSIESGANNNPIETEEGEMIGFREELDKAEYAENEALQAIKKFVARLSVDPASSEEFEKLMESLEWARVSKKELTTAYWGSVVDVRVENAQGK